MSKMKCLHTALGLLAAWLSIAPCLAREVAYFASFATLSVVDPETDVVTRTFLLGDLNVVGVRHVAVAPDGRWLYLAGAYGVDVFDPVRGVVVASIALETPQRIAVSPDGRTAYVSTYDRLAVIDTASNSIVGFVDDIDHEIDDFAFSPDGNLVYVATSTDLGGVIQIVETSTRRARRSILLGERVARLVISPDGRTAYAAAGYLLVIDLEAEVLAQQLAPVGRDLAVSPDGRLLYGLSVLSPHESEVAVVDLLTRQPIVSITVGVNVQRLALSRNGDRLYAYDSINEGCIGVVAIDPIAHKVLRGIDQPGATAVVFGEQQQPLATPTSTATPRRSTTPLPLRPCVYASQYSSNQVRVVDASTYSLVGAISLKQPNRMVISDDGTRLYVTALTNGGATGSIAVIDTSVGRVADTLPVFAGQTLGVALSPDDDVVYASLFGSSCDAIVAAKPLSREVRGFASIEGDGFLPNLVVDGGRAFVLHPRTQSMLVIDVDSGLTRAEIPLGIWGFDLSRSSDGKRIYIAGALPSADGQGALPGLPAPLVVVDLQSESVVDRIALPSSGNGVDVRQRDGVVAVVGSNQNQTAGHLFLVDPLTREVSAPIVTGTYLYSIAFLPNSDVAFVGTFNPVGVQVVDTARSLVLATIPLADGAQDLVAGLVPGGCVVDTVPTASPTPTVGAICSGDCDLGGSISAGELWLGVQIALQARPTDWCNAVDSDRDGLVTVDELVRASKNASETCEGIGR